MEIVIKNVSFKYNTGTKNEKEALTNINLFLESNLIHGIIGPIGSGKSTLLELMNGITKPTKGEISIGKYNLTKKNFRFNKFRYDVGLVYQFPEKQFFCETVADEVAFSQKMLGKSKNLKKRIVQALKMVGLDETYLYRSPFNLNGGEKRRVAIASILISNPELLILDEPTVGLDNNSKRKLMKLLLGLKTKYGKTIVIVTHDVDMLYDIVDNVIALNNGKVVTEGNKVFVFGNTKLLNDNNTPIPNIVRFERLIYDRTGIDLGYQPDINSLVRSIAKTFQEKRGDSDE